MPKNNWTTTILYVNSALMIFTGWVFFLLQRPFDGFGYVQFGFVNLLTVVMQELYQWEQAQWKERHIITEDEDEDEDEDEVTPDIDEEEVPSNSHMNNFEYVAQEQIAHILATYSEKTEQLLSQTEISEVGDWILEEQEEVANAEPEVAHAEPEVARAEPEVANAEPEVAQPALQVAEVSIPPPAGESLHED